MDQSHSIALAGRVSDRALELKLLLLVAHLEPALVEQITVGLRTCLEELGDIEAAIEVSEPVEVL